MAKRMLKKERHELVAAVADDAPEGMQLLELWIENVMKVKWLHLKPKGSVIVVGGKNGQGKSTALKCIGFLLGGLDMIPTDVIHEGKNTGKIVGQIGPFTVTRLFTRVPPEKSTKGNRYYSRIMVTGPRGEEFPSPQVLLNKFLGFLSFDPLQFLRKKPAEQCETVRTMAKFDVDLDAIDAAQKADYEARREQRYEVDSLKNRLEAMEEPAEGTPVELVDVQALTEKMQGAANHNSVVAVQRREKASVVEIIATKINIARKMREDALELLGSAQEIDGFEVQFGETDDEVYTFDLRKVDRFQIFGSTTNGGGEIGQLEESINAMEIGEEIDMAFIAEQLNAANANNAVIAKAMAYRDLQSELEVATTAWTEIDTRMKERDVERDAAMQRAQLPIEGLNIGDGEIFFAGKPFDQASGAEQIRVSLALGMANNPKLKVLRFLDGGWDMLDEDSQALVREMVERNGFQLWVEHVGGGDTVTVLMEDGEAVGDDVEVDA